MKHLNEYQSAISESDIFQRDFDKYIKNQSPKSTYGHLRTDEFKGHGIIFDNGYKYITVYDQRNGLVTMIISPENKILSSI